MASMFSPVPYVSQVARGTCVQKCHGSKIFVRKTQKHVVVRACSEQKEPVISTSLSIEESEANGVAGNFPDPPPLTKPACPTADLEQQLFVYRAYICSKRSLIPKLSDLSNLYEQLYRHGITGLPVHFRNPPLEFIVDTLCDLAEIEDVYRGPDGELPPKSWHTMAKPTSNYCGIRLIIPTRVPRHLSGVEQWSFVFREFSRSERFLIPKSYDMSEIYAHLHKHGIAARFITRKSAHTS